MVKLVKSIAREGIGITHTVASDASAYVDIAVGLADRARRRDPSERLRTATHLAWHDTDAIASLTTCLSDLK
ncbi:hypothetical protein [Azospirillum canadense]|uniref:hypothetical protein n=1 Tax=Azospirillum canadense TaxID=403962 RepID=UPI00222622E8|nr:hypothetical protein [Azospirillum canadense]MCW2239089.1 putative O-linked N-acetylglucosamine transferase (SPINDLY family) [Azospirillum canadense]